MTGDQATFVGVLVASLLGSTGLAGLFTGSLEIGRRARLRRLVARALDLRDRFKARTVEWEALSYSAKLDSVRLAAMSSVGLKRRMRSWIPMVAVVLGFYSVIALALATGREPEDVGFGIGRFIGGDRDTLLLSLILTIVTLAVSFVAIIDSTLRRDRREFVRRVMEGMSVAHVASKLDR